MIPTVAGSWVGSCLSACREQVILEEKLIWQSPANSSFSLPAQGGGGEPGPRDLSNRSLDLPPSQSFFLGSNQEMQKSVGLKRKEKGSMFPLLSICDGRSWTSLTFSQPFIGPPRKLETAQQLRALAAVLKDPSLISSTHNCLKL